MNDISYKLLAALFAIIGVPVLMYFGTFGLSGFSDKQDVWGQFGDFMNVWVSFANLIILTFLTLDLRKKDRKDGQIKERPLLICKQNNVQSEWTVINIGSGAAINIVFSYKESASSPWRARLVKMYSMAPGESLKLNRSFKAFEIGLSYSDVHGNLISSSTKEHDTAILIDQDLFADLNRTVYETLKDWETERSRRFFKDDTDWKDNP